MKPDIGDDRREPAVTGPTIQLCRDCGKALIWVPGHWCPACEASFSNLKRFLYGGRARDFLYVEAPVVPRPKPGRTP
jgi:hypothetical protein